MTSSLAVVTGASSGIGVSLARELAKRGYDLVICSAGERLESAVQELQGFGVEVRGIQVDLATRQGVDELWRGIQALGRSVDIACINAGVGVGGLFYETDLEAELNMIELNCVRMVQLAKYFVREMVGRGEGRILITSSIAGEMVAPSEAVYAATKAFDLSFAHSLRYELRDTGITVTALQPGPTDTHFFHRAGMDDTEVGRKGKFDNEPDEVGQGIDALLAGDDHVYAGSMKVKTEGSLADLMPGSVKGSMHEKQARPVEERKAS